MIKYITACIFWRKKFESNKQVGEGRGVGRGGLVGGTVMGPLSVLTPLTHWLPPFKKTNPREIVSNKQSIPPPHMKPVLARKFELGGGEMRWGASCDRWVSYRLLGANLPSSLLQSLEMAGGLE